METFVSKTSEPAPLRDFSLCCCNRKVFARLIDTSTRPRHNADYAWTIKKSKHRLLSFAPASRLSPKNVNAPYSLEAVIFVGGTSEPI
jgi:hypothetical protein